jgi:hypothetical protein
LSGRVAITVACAVAASFSYALSNVLQQSEAEQVASEHALRLGLLPRLARRPRWLVGMGADVGGYVFEALALAAGAVVLVEPILSTSLLLSLFLGAVLNKRRVGASLPNGSCRRLASSVYMLIVKHEASVRAPSGKSSLPPPDVKGFETMPVWRSRKDEPGTWEVIRSAFSRVVAPPSPAPKRRWWRRRR